MKRIIVTLLVFIFLSLSLGIQIVVAEDQKAVTVKDFPTEIKIGDEESLSFSAVLEPNSTYYYKVRAGDSKSTAETFNSSSNKWLGDKSAWTEFPQLETGEDGRIKTDNQAVMFRIKQGTTVGNTELQVRVKSTDTEYSLDSSPVVITILTPDPTPTPTPTPTPMPTTTPAPTHNYDNITITEIYPSPKGDGEDEEEWVEIYNNNDGEANLNSWYIKDGAGNKKRIDNFTIPGKSYATFNFSSGLLNNNGDSVILLNADEQEKDAVHNYPEIEKGYSWAKISGSWCLSKPTKNGHNGACITLANPSPSSSPSSSPESVLGAASKTKKSAFENESANSEDMLGDENGRDLPQLATPSGKALGMLTSASEITTPSASKRPTPLLPIGIAGTGIIMLGGAGFPFIKPKVIEYIAKIKSRQ
ncbi:MAG: lamin tail domain-containing protein [Patescibacteria group bacterium]